jgi:hypothetical protein
MTDPNERSKQATEYAPETKSAGGIVAAAAAAGAATSGQPWGRVLGLFIGSCVIAMGVWLIVRAGRGA